MSNPLIVEMPHNLGIEAAKDRLSKGLDKLASFIPGSAVTDSQWSGDTLSFKIHALGQTASAQLDVFEDRVRALVELPPMLSLFARKARDFLTENGRKLLR